MDNVVFVILTEVLMTPFIVWLINYILIHAHSLSNVSYSVELILLVMMGSMLDSLVYYLATPPSFFSVVLAVSIAMLAMTSVIVYALWVITVKPVNKSLNRRQIIVFALFLVWNEISMGVFLRILAYPFSDLVDPQNILSYFGNAITNYLFLAPMLAEMLFFLIVSMKKPLERRVAFSIFLMQVADPAMLGRSPAVVPLLISYAIIMLFVIIFTFSYMYRIRVSLKTYERRLFSLLILIISVSAISLIIPVFITNPFGLSWFALALSMILSMFIYFEIVLGLFTRFWGHPSAPREMNSLLSG